MPPRRGDGTRSLTGLAQGFRERTWVTARLTARGGLRALSSTIAPGRARAPRRSDADAVGAATRLVAELDGLKGLMMKVGQMASYLDPSLPPEAQQVLSTLQAGARPMEFDAIDEVVVEELGASARELFDDFEETPFAAASIGQVHRARLEGGDVAVKVQYPGIRDAIASDLGTVGALARLGTVGMSLDTREIFAELEERLLEECDYRAEARHQQTFARLLSDIPGASVPAVVAARSSERVLTTELVRRRSFADFVEAADQEAKDRAGELIFGACYGSIHRHGLYNADPHPGNYLFGDDGEVTFLDFGCVRAFPRPMVENWKRMALAVLAGDKETFRQELLQTGMVVRADRFDWDHHWEVMLYIYEPFMTKDFRFTHDYVRRSYDLMLWGNPNTRHMTFPRTWLWVNRLQWGLNSVLAHLEATAPWDELWRAAIEAEVVEELGGT